MGFKQYIICGIFERKFKYKNCYGIKDSFDFVNNLFYFFIYHSIIPDLYFNLTLNLMDNHSVHALLFYLFHVTI